MKYLLSACFAFLVFFSAYSQPSSDIRQRLLEEKKAFFTEHIGLTKSEAIAFWPVYNDYQSRKNRIAAEKRTLMRYYLENKSNMKDQEITETLEKYLALEKQESELFVSYNSRIIYSNSFEPNNLKRTVFPVLFSAKNTCNNIPDHIRILL